MAPSHVSPSISYRHTHNVELTVTQPDSDKPDLDRVIGTHNVRSCCGTSESAVRVAVNERERACACAVSNPLKTCMYMWMCIPK